MAAREENRTDRGNGHVEQKSRRRVTLSEPAELTCKHFAGAFRTPQSASVLDNNLNQLRHLDHYCTAIMPAPRLTAEERSKLSPEEHFNLSLSQFRDRFPKSTLDRSRPRKPVVLALMRSSRTPFVKDKPKKRPPPWRKSERVELSEELRDLERDIAKHSQPGMQEPQTGNPASISSSTRSKTRRRQWSASATKPAPEKTTVQKRLQVIDDICDLERDTRAPSLAKDGRSQRADWP